MKPKNKLKIFKGIQGITIQQAEPYKNGRGGWKWDKQTVILDSNDLKKLIKIYEQKQNN